MKTIKKERERILKIKLHLKEIIKDSWKKTVRKQRRIYKTPRKKMEGKRKNNT